MEPPWSVAFWTYFAQKQERVGFFLCSRLTRRVVFLFQLPVSRRCLFGVATPCTRREHLDHVCVRKTTSLTAVPATQEALATFHACIIQHNPFPTMVNHVNDWLRCEVTLRHLHCQLYFRASQLGPIASEPTAGKGI